MARAARARTEPQQAEDIRHQIRRAIAYVMFAGVVGLGLYGAWLALLMHLSKTMPDRWIAQFAACAVLAAALYTICVRVEPLPARRKRRGKRWIDVETPTLRQIWQTAPGDFIEAIFAAIGIMAAPAMMFIGFGAFIAHDDFLDLMIVTAVCAGAFAIEGTFVSWRGRNMFDPPGQVRAAKAEPSQAAGKDDDRSLEIGEPSGSADASAAGNSEAP